MNNENSFSGKRTAEYTSNPSITILGLSFILYYHTLSDNPDYYQDAKHLDIRYRS